MWQVLRRLGNSLANHRASLSSELGSLWDFFKIERDRRRSATTTTYEPILTESKSPVKLARDLLQVIQETVFTKKDDEPKRCPLVKEESDLSSEEDEGTDSRIANLIDFFFTIVKSQKEDRKGSGGSCFKSEASPDEARELPKKVNRELEEKMDTLMEFLATTGCMNKEDQTQKEGKKITLMEFLFGVEERKMEIVEPKSLSLSESNVNVKLCYIDETPNEDGTESFVEILLKYMEDYKKEDNTKSMSVTPSLSEKSKSDVTISKLETFSDISKTKSDSTLTHTQETVVDRGDENPQGPQDRRRISEANIDLSYVKQDLEEIINEALNRVEQLTINHDDTMSEQEDFENYNAYTKPPQYFQYFPYSIELSDILEEDELSYREQESDSFVARRLAEELLNYIEAKVERHFDDSEFDLSPVKRSSSLIDLRSIPDLPPSMIIKPRVARMNRSTSTTEISDSNSDLSRRMDSGCMTEDTTLSSSSERNERALDKLESLHKFFSKSRLEIIDESDEHLDKAKSRRRSKVKSADLNVDQSSLDDVEDLQADNESKDKDQKKAKNIDIAEDIRTEKAMETCEK